MSVKVRLDIRNKLKSLNSTRTNAQVADVVVDEMKKSIASGISPVRGVGRFVSYKHKDRYPLDKKTQSEFPQKAARPVNLRLSGDMLNALTAKSGSSIRVGIFDPDQAEKALNHQEGLNGVPERRFIPEARGEDFTVSIKRKIIDAYAKLVSEIIELSK